MTISLGPHIVLFFNWLKGSLTLCVGTEVRLTLRKNSVLVCLVNLNFDNVS